MFKVTLGKRASAETDNTLTTKRSKRERRRGCKVQRARGGGRADSRERIKQHLGKGQLSEQVAVTTDDFFPAEPRTGFSNEPSKLAFFTNRMISSPPNYEPRTTNWFSLRTLLRSASRAPPCPPSQTDVLPRSDAVAGPCRGVLLPSRRQKVTVSSERQTRPGGDPMRNLLFVHPSARCARRHEHSSSRDGGEGSMAVGIRLDRHRRGVLRSSAYGDGVGGVYPFGH
jgi:hypothetical protein